MAKGVPYEQKTRDLAFRVWRESGQNWSEALRRLKGEYGLAKLTRDRLYDWANRDNWNDRAARLQAEAERAEVAQFQGRERILADLERQKARYEAYFEKLPPEQVDNAATGAYANLLKVMEGMQTKIEAGAGLNKLDLAKDMLAQEFEFVRKAYPQHVAAFMEIMEPFGEKLVEIYG